MVEQVKGILIDSGRVLNGPVTGHWFITPNFFRFIDEQRFRSISKSRRNQVFQKASEYISKQKLIRTEHEEYIQFLEHYRIIAEELPELKLTDEQIELVTKDLVFNYSKYVFFDDVKEVIPLLSKEFKLAVVSDAWPSLENVFSKAGMRKYFTSFVVSSILGVIKPDELMYKTALIELDLSPKDVIFIDDSIRNCDGAKRVGIEETYLLCRDIRLFIYHKITCKNHKVVRSFHDIKKVLSKSIG